MRAQTIHREQAHLDSDHVEVLDERLRGPLLREGEAGYDEARAVWNGMIDRRPALIVRAAGAADVMDAVRFAREHELLLAVRGGGHNVDGLRVGHAGRGRLDDGRGRAHPRRRHRLALQQVWPELRQSPLGRRGNRERRARARQRRRKSRPLLGPARRGRQFRGGDLLRIRAPRGRAGGRVRRRHVPAGRSKAAPAGLARGAPDEVSSQALFWSVPEAEAFPEEVRGRPVLVLGALYSGDPDEGQQVLKPLRGLADPVLDMSGVMPYRAVQASFDPFYPEGELQYYWKSTRLAGLDEEVIGALVDHASDRPSPRTHLIVWHQGGAMRRVRPEETAFGDRSAPYLLTIDSTWSDPAQAEENVAWTRAVWEDLQRFSTGGLYLNFPGLGEEGEDLVRSAYGGAYERLVEVKNRWDPDNLFRMNQNIAPSA